MEPGPSVTQAQDHSVVSAYLFILWLVATQIVWAFAFAGLPEATPEWLRRARYICFGSDDSGIPDMRGWILLVLAPLSLLGSLFVSYRADLAPGFRKILEWRPAFYLLTLLVGILLLQVFLVSGRILNGLDVIRARAKQIVDLTNLPANYPQLKRLAPDFSLIDQTGKRVNLVSFHGKPLILSFVFAHCQTICPLITRNINQASQILSRSKVNVLYVTLDPRRDTPSALPDLASRWELPVNTFVLSGEVLEVERVHREYNVGSQRDEKSGDIVHPPLVYIIDGDGLIRYALTNPAVHWIVDAVTRTLAE